MSEFKERVLKIIRSIPYGKVVSYGQVGAYAGTPRAARQVGWILNRSEGQFDLPWWRVVNNQGRLSIKNSEYSPHVMRQLLEAEGVVIGSDYTFDIEKYRFRPSAELLSQWQLDDSYIQRLIERFGL